MEANAELIPLKDAARISGFSRQGLWARIQSGKLAATRPGNEWLVHWRDVLALVGTKSKGGRPKKVVPPENNS